MVSGPRVVLVLSLIVLSVVTAAPGLAATDSTTEQPQTDDGTEITQTMVIDLQRNGDARWTVTKTFELTTRNETEAFEELATDFENGQTEDLGLASYRRASQLAAESTGREMEITGVTRNASRTGTATNGTGRLSISFTWTNFGRIDGDNFYIDDVFTTNQGPWLDGLYANQQLIIRPPEGYKFFDAPVPVTLRNGTIRWAGPQEFDANTLSATFERTGSVGPGTATPTTTTGPPPGESDSGSLLWIGLVTLGLGAAAVGYLLVRDGDVLERPTGDESGGAATESTDGGSASAAAGGATAESETPEPEDSESEAIDEELLSDEERVERLLEQNGGRMKQANIVKETDWSNAKVSQLLSSMEEEGQIDKLRIGRENLISFPDEDVTDIEE